MELPRLGIERELQLLAYTTVPAAQDLSCDCDLHHRSWQCCILNSLSEARDQTCILMNTSWLLNPLSHHRNSSWQVFFNVSVPSFPIYKVNMRIINNFLVLATATSSWYVLLL